MKPYTFDIIEDTLERIHSMKHKNTRKKVPNRFTEVYAHQLNAFSEYV